MIKKKIRHIMFFAVVAFSCYTIGVGCGSSESLSGINSSSAATDSFVVSDARDMGVGDVMYLQFDTEGNAEIDFSGVSSESKFYMILQSYSQSSASFIATMGNEAAHFDKGIASYLDESMTNDPVASFNLMLREKDNEISESEGYVEANPNYSVSKSVQSGDVETFRVLSSISSTSVYDEVDAEVYCVGEYAIFYVDLEVAAVIPNELTEADVDELCVNFDKAVETEYNIYGQASDVNSDGKFAVLMTPAVNELGASGGGIITGYFYAGDLYARTTSNKVSNEREILYTMVPDSDGVYGLEIPKEFAMSNLLPAVLPHELQHAISYNNHVFINHSSSEAAWLNEALSHFTEDLTGYNLENPSRMELYLQSPASYSLVTLSSPPLQNRGAAYLFLRYMYEQSDDPEAFLSNLHNTELTGTANVEAAFGSSDSNFDEFYEFMRRWAIAVALTDSGVTADSKYVYQSRTKHPDTDNWQGVCLKCDAEDNRDTILDGPAFEEYVAESSITVKGTASRFFEINNVPSSLPISGSASADMGGVLIKVQ